MVNGGNRRKIDFRVGLGNFDSISDLICIIFDLRNEHKMNPWEPFVSLTEEDSSRGYIFKCSNISRYYI